MLPAAYLSAPALQDCKVLIVAASKAFFNLYTTLSGAGIIAVQLDRDKKLLQAQHRDPLQVVQHAGPLAATGSSSRGCDSGCAAEATADPAQQAVWQSSVQASLVAASCVLATHEQLHHPCMPLNMFDALVEFVPWDVTAAGTAAASEPDMSAVQAAQAAVQASFGKGRHFILTVQQPDLEQAAAEAAAGTADDAQQHPVAAAAPRPSPIVAAAGHAATRDPTQTAAAQEAAATEQEAAADGSELSLPLVLNVYAGSPIKQRQALYQALMQLEAQGFVLVERVLGGSRSTPAPAASAAVDVVMSPNACLCIWADNKLPRVSSLPTLVGA